MDFNFISPPSILEQQVVHETHQPVAVMGTQQHIVVHQVHNPGLSLHHPIIPWNSMYPFLPSTPLNRHYSTSMPSVPMVSMGDMAMQNFAPKFHTHDFVHPSRRVAYIVTYSTARMATGDPSAIALYEQALLASGLQPVITFDTSHFPQPPADLCAQFTGVSAPIQEVVRQSASGMRDL